MYKSDLRRNLAPTSQQLCIASLARSLAYAEATKCRLAPAGYSATTRDCGLDIGKLGLRNDRRRRHGDHQLADRFNGGDDGGAHEQQVIDSLKGRRSRRTIIRKFPYFVKLVVPPDGFGRRLDATYAFHGRGAIRPHNAKPPRRRLRRGDLTWCFTAVAFSPEFVGRAAGNDR